MLMPVLRTSSYFNIPTHDLTVVAISWLPFGPHHFGQRRYRTACGSKRVMCSTSATRQNQIRFPENWMVNPLATASGSVPVARWRPAASPAAAWAAFPRMQSHSQRDGWCVRLCWRGRRGRFRKCSQLDSGHAGAVFVRSQVQLMGLGPGFCDSQSASRSMLLKPRIARIAGLTPAAMTPAAISQRAAKQRSEL